MRIGVCVDGRSSTSAWKVKALGATSVSLQLRAGADLDGQFRALRAAGYSILGVLGSAAVGDPQTWRDSLEYALRQLGPLQALAVGHEPDDGWRPGVSDDPWVWPRGGIGSWALSAEALGEMLFRVQRFLSQNSHTQVPLWIGGISRPEYLARLDLSQVHGVLVNPYHYRPEAGWPSPDWGMGNLAELLDQFQEVIEAQGLQGQCRLGIGELGISDYQVDRGLAAEWFARTLNMLERRGDIDCAYVYCDSDLTLDGYGQFDVIDRPKPSVAAIKLLADRFNAVLGPELPDELPDELPEGETPLPWVDPHFSTEIITRCLATLAGFKPPRDTWPEIEEVWSAVGPWLDMLGLVDSIEAKVALLAAVTIETDYTLLTVTDPADYDWCERLFGCQTELGQALGNRYPGDGQRYRGRGLVLIRGRAQYAHYGARLDLPLLDEPDLALEPAVAAGLAVARFSDLDLFDAARQGHWATVLRGLDPAINRYDLFIRAVEVFSQAVEEVNPGLEPTDLLDAVFDRAFARIGDPYLWGGGQPGGFDAGGFVAWAYLATPGLPLLSNYPDTLYDETIALSPGVAKPGDLIFYEYEDQSGLRYPHVGLVTGQRHTVLDARDGVGVGYHAHIQGALRHYRRVSGLVELAQEADEAMWKEKYEILELQLYGRMEATRALLKQCGPSEPPKIGDKKETWVKFGVDLDQRYDRLYEFLDLLVERGVGDAESREDHEEQADAQQGQAEGDDGGQEDDQADASDAAGPDGDPRTTA